MARRNTKPSARPLSDLVNELNNNEEYGYKQLRERLAVEREARAANAVEEEEPQGFLSSAPSDLEVTASMQATPEEGWMEGVQRAGYEAISGLFGDDGYGNTDARPLIDRAGSGVGKMISAVLPDAIERGMNLGQASIAMGMPEGQVMDTTTGRMRSDRAERMGVAAQEREQADMFQASRSTQEAMRKMSDAETLGGWLEAATPTALGQMLGESVGQQLPQMAITAGSLGLGLPLMAASTYNAEFQGAVEEAAQKDGVDINDPLLFDRWMRENPTKVAEAESKGRTRGSIIAGVDLVTFGAGGAVAKAVDNTGLKRAAFLAGANLVADVGGGAGGEAAAQLATDGKIQMGEVLNEGFAGLPLSLTQTPGQIVEGARRGREIEAAESYLFNNSIDQAIIEQGNAQLVARQAEQAEYDRAVNEARLSRAEGAIAQNEQNKKNAWTNASTPDMFGADPDIVGTFEEQEALRRYEDERHALSLQERRRAFEAAEQAKAADEAAYAQRVEASREEQFAAAEAERAQVAASQAEIENAFRDPDLVEQDNAPQETAITAAFKKAAADAVAKELKAAEDYRAAQKRADSTRSAEAIAEAEIALDEYEKAQQERIEAEKEEGFRLLEEQEARRVELARTANSNSAMQNNPMAQQLAAIGALVGRSPANSTTAQTNPPAAEVVQEVAPASQEVTTPENSGNVGRSTARVTQSTSEGNGFIGPARGRRTEPNVGESRTTRIDESDPLPFPAMQRSAGTVREDAPVAEDVVQEQLELHGMDVVQPEQTTDAALQAARKKREDRIKKEKSEALKKAKAAYAKDREKFLDDLLERGLTPAQERKQLQDWMDKNPEPTEGTVTVAPAPKPKAAVDPQALAAKAVADRAKKDVASWRRGLTTATNRATAEARSRGMNQRDTVAFVAQRAQEYLNANPNPSQEAAAEATPANEAVTIREDDPRIQEQIDALRMFDTTTSDADLRAQVMADLSLNQELDGNLDSNPIPEDKRASLEDVRKLLGLPTSNNARSARRAIGNGIVQLVTEETANNFRSRPSATAVAWYNGGKLYVNVNRLNKDNLMGELMGAIGHEGKHAADASGKGKRGISHFIGVEANRRLRTRIEEAASRGDRAAANAVRRARSAADARPDLPGLYEVELPAYYITEVADRPTTLARGLISAVRTGAKELLGVKDVNLNDVQYMADKMVENLSYESSADGSVQELLDRQAGTNPDQLDGQTEELDQAAYHGTPHNVDRFTTQRIGSGEGNQSYGWGLYFASERAVAEYYRDTLGGEGNLYQAEVPESSDLIDYDRAVRDSSPELLERLAPAIDRLAKEKQKNTTRRMNSEEARQSVLRGTGKELYQQLVKLERTPRRASEYLNSMGVPGLQYTDGQSRGRTDEGTKNIVIWDDSQVSAPIALNQDVDGSRYNPTPGAELSRSAAGLWTKKAGEFVRGMLFSDGGLGRDMNAKLQDSVGEAAHYAALAQKSQWEMDRGVARFAERNNMTVDEANAEVAKRMEALETIASPSRREAALSNYVAANPELTPMLDMYRSIAAGANKIADSVLARRPLTEADRKFAQSLKDSAFAYLTRIYTSRQGNEGRDISRKMLRTAAKATKKVQKGEALTKQEQEAYTRYNEAATYLMERLTIPPMETLLGMRQTRLNELFDTWAEFDSERFREAAYDDAIRQGMDETTAKEVARMAMIEKLDGLREVSQVETLLNEKADVVIRSLLGLSASSPTASTVGGLREDRGILQKREDLAPELRRLMGEVTTSPSVMLAVTMAKQGELIARENFLNKLAESGLVVPQNIAGTGIFAEHTVKLRGDTAGALKDMMTTPEVARIVNAQLEMYSSVTDAAAISFMQSDVFLAALARAGMKGMSKLAGSAKMMSVVFSPFASIANAIGSVLMLLPNGVYNPRMVKDAAAAAKDSVMNTIREGGNYSDVLANAVRWNVIDSARLQELRRSVHQALKDKVVNPSVGNKALHNVKRGVGGVTETFAMTDAWTKIAAFIKQQDYLAKFYEAEGIKKTADEISSEAAQIVRDTNFTYSRVPPIIRNVFERSGTTMFATYFYSVPLTIAGNYQQAYRDIVRAKNATTAAGRAEATQMAITRLGGTTAVTAILPVMGQMLAQAINGMGDEDEEKVKAMANMMREGQPYADPIYLGKDKDGNPLFFLFNRIDPYGPFTDLVRIYANKDLSNDQKFDEMLSMVKGMWFTNSAIAEAYKVLSDEERGNTSTRLERLPGIGDAVLGLQSTVGYADWARSLTTLADRAFVPGAVNVLDPENPSVEGDYNSTVAQLLGVMTFASGGKAVKADPATALRSLGFEIKKKKDSARKRVAQAIANGDSPERIADMIVSSSNDMFHDFERVQRTYNGMVDGFDMSPRAAAAVLKSREGAGLNDVQVGLIRRGLLRGDKEMAIELAGLLSEKSVTDRVARTRGFKDDKEQAVTDAKSVLRILRQEYGMKVGE